MTATATALEKELERKKRATKFLNTAIVLHMKDKFDFALSKGADVNYTDDEIDAPLLIAICHHNNWARKFILQNGGNAKIISKPYQRAPLQGAVYASDQDAIEELVDYKVDVKMFREMNLLHSAIEELSSYGLLHNATFTRRPDLSRDDSSLKKEIEDFFLQQNSYKRDMEKFDEGTPFKLEGPIHAYYSGNLDMLSYLLGKGVSPTLSALGIKRTPYQVAKTPANFTEVFRSGEDEELTFLEHEGSNVLKFKIKFNNITTTASFDLIVHYDLKPCCELIESHTNVADQIQDLSYTVQRRMSDEFRELHSDRDKLKQHVSVIEKVQSEQCKRAEERDRIVDQKLGVENEKRIKMICNQKNTERFFDVLSRKMETMLDAWKLLGSGAIQRVKNSKADYAKTIIDFVGAHVPAPFITPFLVLSKACDGFADLSAQKRFDSIGKLLPSDRSVQVYSRELACEITEGLVKYMNKLRTDVVDKITPEAMEDIAKRAFIQAVQTIYEVEKLNISSDLPSASRTRELTAKVLKSVAESDYFRSLVEEKVKGAVTPPVSPTLPPAIPPRPIVHSFDKAMMKAAADAKEREHQARASTSGKFSFGLSKLKEKLTHKAVEVSYS